MRLQRLLADFVFRDSRLESHPKILATHVRVVSRDSLDLVAEVSKHPLPFGSRSLSLSGSLSGQALDKREAIVCSDAYNKSRDAAADFLGGISAQSMLAVPILNGAEAVGVISLMSTEKDFFGAKDIGRAQLPQPHSRSGQFPESPHRPQPTVTGRTQTGLRFGQAGRNVRREFE